MSPSRSGLRGATARRSAALDRSRETRQDGGNPARSALPLRHVETNRKGSLGIGAATPDARLVRGCGRKTPDSYALPTGVGLSEPTRARHAQRRDAHEQRLCHAFTSLVGAWPCGASERAKVDGTSQFSWGSGGWGSRSTRKSRERRDQARARVGIDQRNRARSFRSRRISVPRAFF